VTVSQLESSLPIKNNMPSAAFASTVAMIDAVHAISAAAALAAW
jgi:hypothetical protein